MAEDGVMPPVSDDAVLRAWEEDLRAALVTPAGKDRVRQVAASAASAVSAGAAATGAASSAAATVGTAGISIGAKIAVVGALVAALGGAAAAGVLPDPIQRWIADLVDGVGIEIPRPSSVVPGDVDTPIEVEIPDLDDSVESPVDLLP